VNEPSLVHVLHLDGPFGALVLLAALFVLPVLAQLAQLACNAWRRWRTKRRKKAVPVNPFAPLVEELRKQAALKAEPQSGEEWIARRQALAIRPVSVVDAEFIEAPRQ
jgi:hypothetical protein